jgi:serine/threonine-protein kinase
MSIPAEGEVLAGKYRVERVLGQGGVGIVLAAKHLQLGQRVAIKMLLKNATNESVTRFLREARAAVRLKSEHVARVVDVGEIAPGEPYMVMEYLEGTDLSQIVKSGGPLAVQDAVAYVLHACEAIAEAHSMGIIHRDLKPANLFLTTAADGSNTVKVLDFGISKVVDGDPEGDGMQLTKASAILGSPHYMSPEQMNSASKADARSDIWALGAILYQLLSGKVPFETKVLYELIVMVSSTSPPPISSFRSDVPPGLEAAVFRCLEKKPAARFPNVAELALAIAEYGPAGARTSAEKTTRTLETSGISVSLTPPPSTPKPPPATLTAMASTGATTGQQSRPGMSRVILGGAAAGVVIAAALVFVSLRGSSSPPSSPPSSAAPVSAPDMSAPTAPRAAVTPEPPAVEPAPPSSGAASEPTAEVPAAAPAKSAGPRVKGQSRKDGGSEPVKPPVTATATATAKNPLKIDLK